MFDYYSVPLPGMLRGGGTAGGIAKAAKKAARKQAKVDAAQLGNAAKSAAHAPPPPPPPPPALNDPGAQPARNLNAAHDEFGALHLLWHNTGLGA